MKKLYFLATICILINHSCAIMDPYLYFSKKVPNDVVFNKDPEGKCIAMGGGGAVYSIYHWPETEESQRIFNEWWSHAGSMGTKLFLLPDHAPFRLYFSKQLWVSFADDYYITYHYTGEKDVGTNPLFVRRTNKYDRALFKYILKQVYNDNTLPEEAAKILGKKCIPDFYYDHLRVRPLFDQWPDEFKKPIGKCYPPYSRSAPNTVKKRDAPPLE